MSKKTAKKARATVTTMTYLAILPCSSAVKGASHKKVVGYTVGKVTDRTKTKPDGTVEVTRTVELPLEGRIQGTEPSVNELGIFEADVRMFATTSGRDKNSTVQKMTAIGEKFFPGVEQHPNAVQAQERKARVKTASKAVANMTTASEAEKLIEEAQAKLAELRAIEAASE